MGNLYSRSGDAGLLILRIGVAIIFIYSGWEKLTNISGTGDFLTSLGIPNPQLMAWLLAFVEFFGGILVLFGAYATIPYLLLAIVMAVALYTTKLGGDFGSARLDILLLASTLALFFTGSGDYSVDYKIKNR